MTQTFYRRFKAGRKSRTADVRSRRRAASPGGDALEDRTLRAVIGLTASASPVVLRPLNPLDQPHAVQVATVHPVTLSGYVVDDLNVTPVVTFQVIDEYGKIEPGGKLISQQVKPGVIFYSARFGLSMTSRPGDSDGRQYTIIVTARDAENTRTTAVSVKAPPASQLHRPRVL
jgi:hypothetical protein